MPRVNYQGLALTGTLSQLKAAPQIEAKRALEIVADLARHITAAGCLTSTIVCGFWKPTNTWRLYVQLLEDVNTTPKTRWWQTIREKVASVTSHTKVVVPLGNEALVRDWFDYSTEKWLYYTHFVVHRGIPLIPWANWVHNGTESLAFMRLLRNDLQMDRFDSPPSKQVTGVLSRTLADLNDLLVRLVLSSPPTHITDSSLHLGTLSAQVLGLVLAFVGLVQYERR
ncbi:hypothetical protein BDW59DRAFT_156788 [Aspergillus cavernicola]|uniref:Uncharacterized protein n=1 Tax=Aspergillus cavernicola TaxID=176166 RepID=A0ABR4IZR7_9EURO